MDKDRITGSVEQGNGTVKEGVGKAAGDTKLEDEQEAPLRTEPIHSNPQWLMKAGVVFGGIVLLSFIGLAILSGTAYPDFICNSFALLAAVFAFGAALSGAFIGGGAAAQGRFGTAATQHSMRYSVGGGAAFLIIAFSIFKVYQPDSQSCRRPPPPKDKEVHLIFKNVPLDLSFAGLDDHFWRKETEGRYVRTLVVLARQDSKHANLVLPMKDNSDSECTILIRTEETESAITQSQPYNSYEREPYAGDELVFDMDMAWKKTFISRQQAREEVRKGGQNSSIVLKEMDPACFRLELTNKLVAGAIAVVPNELKLFYATTQFTEVNPNVSPSNGSTPRYASFVRSANAEIAQVESFSDLKDLLSSPDGNKRATAQKYLEQHFLSYESEVIKELFIPNQNPNYTSGLLQGLIAGIGADTNGKLMPGQPRNLNYEIRLLQGKENDIVTISGDVDGGVRKQARNLIQRFPVDAFDRIYTGMLDLISQKGCEDYKSSDKQAIIYASIFYYYSRIVQYGFEQSFNAKSAEEVDHFVDKGLRLSNCLNDPQLKIDSASLTYAKTFVYNQHKEVSSKAPGFASQFLALAQTDRGDARYYSPSQIEAAMRIAGVSDPAPNPYKLDENWAQLPDGRKFGAAIKVQVDHSDGKSILVFDRCGTNDCSNSMSVSVGYGKLIAEETAKWAKVIKFAAIKSE